MKNLMAWSLIGPAIALVALLLVIPVATMTATTFAQPGGIFSAYLWFFSSNFRRLVLYRTLEIAAITTAVSVVVGFAAAYAIARMPAGMRRLMIATAVFPLLTGVVVRSFAWLVILGKFGILNTLFLQAGLIDRPLSMLYSRGAVIVALVYLFVPLMILTLVGVLERMPSEIVDAATSLGAGPVAAFRQVTLPLAAPGLIVGAVLVFTGSFTAYATPLLLGGERQMTMGTFLYQRAMVTLDWPGASTVAAIMLVVAFAVVFAMNRLARRLNPAMLQ